MEAAVELEPELFFATTPIGCASHLVAIDGRVISIGPDLIFDGGKEVFMGLIP
jgi:hypothetical protein